MDIEQTLQNLNAAEQMPYMDTICVNPDLFTGPFQQYSKAGWFSSVAQVAAAQEITFFKTRNRAMVGGMFNNMDIADRFNVPFHIFAMGIQFVAPWWSSGNDPANQFSPALWAAELPKLCSFVFKVGQDEKLEVPAVYLCAGAGLVGNSRSVGSNQASGTYVAQSYINGNPRRANNLKFIDPIGIPRNQTIEGRLKISQDGQKLLSEMIAPEYSSANTTGGRWNHTYMIRVFMKGVREVQLRNAQGY